jgi:3-hydroxyacyl-[acyl-carrier-protein] dehydratase
MTRLRGKMGKGNAVARVGDKIVADGEIMFAIMDGDNN